MVANNKMLSAAIRVQRVVQFLIDRGVSPDQIAKVCRVSTAAVSQWRNGKLVGAPSANAALGLAQLSGKSPWWIAFGVGLEDAPGTDVAEEGNIIVRGDTKMIVYYLSDAEHEHMQNFRRLTDDERARVTQDAEVLLRLHPNHQKFVRSPSAGKPAKKPAIKKSAAKKP